MKMSRVWAMANSNTFSCAPIGEMVKRYLKNSIVSIDPFAKDKRWATHTNDINPNTEAEFHLDAYDFLVNLRAQKVKADLIIFDPPYSLRQAKECYESYGEWRFENTQNSGWWKEKAVCYELLKPGGYFLHFGWHTNGMGKKLDCKIIELLVVAHGGARIDTLCIAELKEAHQPKLI